MSDLTGLQKMIMLGALLNGALYLTACFTAGLVTQNPLAWKLAIACAGLCFISYTAQYLSALGPSYMAIAKTAVACSIVAGVGAGVALLLKA